MRSLPRVLAPVALVLPLVGGCTQIHSHRGYIMDPSLTSTLRPGVDNKDSVAQLMGRPTFTGTFNGNDWYYFSRDVRQLAFSTPRPTGQTVLHVRFDQAGNLASVEETGLDKVVAITPDPHATPTLGRERSFFQDVFGNIGTVGAPGSGGGPSNDPTNPGGG